MQLNNQKFAGVRAGLRFQSLTVAVVFLGLSLLVSACGDNTATTAPTTAASTTTPASTTAPATTAAATTAAMTTAAVTTPAAATTGTATTAAMTTASATTTAPTASGTTAAAVASTGPAKLSLDNPTAQAGTTIQVKGEGYPANSWVTIEFGPGTTTRQVASLALVDSTGKFNSPLILRAYGDGSDIEPGANLIKATTQDGSVTANITFNITPATATPDS
ncbi:MAG: hypothetical protein J0I20_17185 [Chloroflexi bacterium]|nr:hypothetical protein [Chloroflexota bacterium]OJV88176.1 MAG: hypothetical protein BGO39_08250 [Chloroflexi bacterium 54-19]